MSRAASLAVLVVGIAFGLLDRPTSSDIMMWIVGALYGGYVMANVLEVVSGGGSTATATSGA